MMVGSGVLDDHDQPEGPALRRELGGWCCSSTAGCCARAGATGPRSRAWRRIFSGSWIPRRTRLTTPRSLGRWPQLEAGVRTRRSNSGRAMRLSLAHRLPPPGGRAYTWGPCPDSWLPGMTARWPRPACWGSGPGRRMASLGGSRGAGAGAGTGLNLEHYPDTVTRLALSEPDHPAANPEPKVKPRSCNYFVATGAGVDPLPHPDETFHAVVSTLVLLVGALHHETLVELHRVWRPGWPPRLPGARGRLQPEAPQRQRRIGPVGWAGNCHLTRTTDHAAAASSWSSASCSASSPFRGHARKWSSPTKRTRPRGGDDRRIGLTT